MKTSIRGGIFRWAALVAAIATATALSMPASAVAGCVAYFYNQSDSVAPVGAIIRGKQNVTVQPVAPGRVSGPIRLPAGAVPAVYASPAMQQLLKGSQMTLPRQADIFFYSSGRQTELGLPLRVDSLARANARALLYFMRVKKSGDAPSPMDLATVAIYDADYRAARAGKALVAVVNETNSEELLLKGEARFDVVFQRPGGGAWDERANTGLSLVAATQVKPGRYHLLDWPNADAETISVKSLRAERSIAELDAGEIRPGDISIYLVRSPGKLEHVMDLPGR